MPYQLSPIFTYLLSISSNANFYKDYQKKRSRKQHNFLICTKTLKQFYEQIIMQELFEILIHKFTLINNKQPILTNAQKDVLLDELLVEKKKEALRILVETRLQQSLDSKRITDSEQLMHILERTHKTMTIHDPDLPLPLRDDPITSVVELFANFFTRQNCTLRAQQILNIHKKKLCPKGLLATTFFSWLVEWTRKQFHQYLKTTIHSLYVNSRQVRPHQSQNKEQTEKQQKQPNSNCLIVKKKPQFPENRSILFSSYRQKRVMVSMMSIEGDQRKVDRIRIKSQSPSQKSLKMGSLESIEIQQNLPINKQIFYFAYAEQIQTLYKSIQTCVPDLDMAFARRLRKGGRRAEVKRRIKQVAKNIEKYMNYIKQNIEKYYKYYWSFHKVIGKKVKKERRATLDMDTLQKSESPSKTSQGNRSISTNKIIDERRKNIISSLSKKHRYAQSQDQSNVQSNLLPNHEPYKIKDKTKNQLELNSKSIQLSFSSSRSNQQSKLLVLNSGYISAQLEIIQQKAQKIKAKASKHHNLHHKKSPHKSKHSKSISITEEQTIQVAYSSLPVTIDVTPASHIRLPKIRRLK